MATLNIAITKNLMEKILPTFGNERLRIPVWDEGQKMFLCDEYESASGHRYYKGIRFSNRIVVVEKVGLYHNCTYIDSIEVYAFNGPKVELVQKRDYEKTFRNEAFILEETRTMVRNYVEGMIKVQRCTISADELAAQAEEIVAGCYKSFLDRDYNIRLTQILPKIGLR